MTNDQWPITHTHIPASMITPLHRRQTPAFWGIVTFVLIALGFIRSSLNYNTPYLDECDYIFVGRALLSGEPWITKTYMFSSDIHLYLYGIADRIFSGESSYIAARALAGLMGLASLWFFYGFVRTLYIKHTDSRRIAELSTLLLALTVPHTFISQFATYDVVCFMFFTASLWLLAKSVVREEHDTPLRKVLILLGGSLLYALAVLAKYVVIAYLPLFFLALLLLNRRAAVIFAVVVGIALGGYVMLYRTELLQLYQNQILGSHKANATLVKILGTALEYSGFTILVALSLVWTRKEKILPAWYYVALAVFALPLVAYHVRSGDVISLYKHVVYACCFCAPVAGEALYALLCRAVERDNDWLRALGAAIVVVACALLGWQLRAVQNAYPNTEIVTRLVRSTMSPHTTILSEDAYLFRYACFPTIPTKNLEEMTWFDNNMDGKRENQDVIDAVWEGKFEYVYLNGLILRELGNELKRGVLRNRYDLVLNIPYTNSEVMNPINTGFLSLYRRRSR